jgi:hypothetical protein
MLKEGLSRFALVITLLVAVVVAVITVPLSLRTLGLVGLTVSVHFGAWLGGVGDHAGEWAGKVAMLLGTGLALLISMVLVVGIPLLVSIAVGLLIGVLAARLRDRVRQGL